MGATPILDPAVLDTLRQLTAPGEPDVLTEVLQIFLREAPLRIDRLRNAAASGDIQEVRRTAHSLKGSAGNIGAQELFAVCRQLDSIGSLDDVGPLVDALGAQYATVEAEIHRLIGA